jgi:hypothetical protein
MLDQASPCEGVCEICRVAPKWDWRRTKLRVRMMRFSGLVVPE